VPSLGGSLTKASITTALRRYYGRPAVEVLLERVHALRLKHGIQGPPFPAREYASAIGVEVIEDRIAIDGLLARRSDGRFAVTLNKNAQSTRKHFTLAHELAHVLLHDDFLLCNELEAESNQLSPHNNEEERLCDHIAAEMLMPSHVFYNDLVTQRLSPLTLFRLSDRYDVSLKAAAVRSSELLKSMICVIWERRGHAINAVWVTPAYVKPIRLCNNGASSVERAFETPREVVENRDTFYGLGRSRIFRMTSSCSLNSTRVLSVISPTKRQ
jgi:Zn-dependent peptidase ImmA (M78 family)